MNILKQYATMAGLSNGNFDGQFKLDEITKGNNFGLGTFEAVDGELVGIDGKFYRLRGDGTVDKVRSKDLSPFASLTNFTSPIVLDLPQSVNHQVLLDTLNAYVNPNRIYALKVSGTFDKVKIRSLFKQSKPYVTLLEASKTQAVMEETNQTGTIVGFLAPKLYNTIMVEGLHLHFINDERTFGGHILDFKIEQGAKLEIIEIDELNLVLDSTKSLIVVDQKDIAGAES